jgi:hypothetical protein
MALLMRGEQRWPTVEQTRSGEPRSALHAGIEFSREGDILAVSDLLRLAHSYVRVQGFRARVLVSGFCRSVVSERIQLHGMGDGALRRRSIKLLCAGWRPHSVFRPGAIPV